MTVPVVLVAGVHGPARTAVVDRLLRENPDAAAIHHDLRNAESGTVVRTVRDTGGLRERTEIRLDHACITCATREDLLPQLLTWARLAPVLVVELWDSVEPRTVAEALDQVDLRDVLRLTAVLTALDAEHLPVDICRGERLRDVAKSSAAGDERFLAEVLARQIEYATALVLPELMPAPLPGLDPEDLALCRDVLSHLAPTIPVIGPGQMLPSVLGPGLCAGELAARVDPATARLPCEAHTPAADTVVWHRTGPLHPERFFDAADALATESVRSRGRFWLANRPDRMIAWDAVAGIIEIQDAGPWLATLPDADWNGLPPERRVVAELDWTPEHGDRVQHLVFTGPNLDRTHIHTLLDACLLTPGEPATPASDPFAPLLDPQKTA
ncbi:GTP-binding protein [Actinocorallia lasiicapitis]